MSSKSRVDNEEMLLNAEDKKKLLSALNRISKAMNEIESLGYIMYVSVDSFNVMNVTKGYNRNLDLEDDMVVASFNHSSTDMGDW